MSDIAVRNGHGETLSSRMEYARTLATSGLLPKAYRNHPENVLYAVEYGRALGLEPITAINSVHIIEGKPSASAGLISALVRRAGHKLRIRVERDGKGPVAVAQIIRRDDPEHTFESRWDWARAQQAGITGKAVWKSYPEAMLKARAITEVAREACEEALLGVGYTLEELDVDVDEDGNPVEGTPAQKRPGATIAEAVEETRGNAPPAESDDRRELEARMGGFMRMLGMGAEDALPFVSEVVGRDVTARSELGDGEIVQVIAALDQRLQERDRRAEAGEDTEPVDAEVVDEPADTAVERSPKDAWDDLLDARSGMDSEEELEARFAAAHEGRHPSSGAVAEIDAFAATLGGE